MALAMLQTDPGNPSSDRIGWWLDELRQDRTGFFRSHLVLNSLYYLSHQNIFNLDLSAAAEVRIRDQGHRGHDLELRLRRNRARADSGTSRRNRDRGTCPGSALRESGAIPDPLPRIQPVAGRSGREREEAKPPPTVRESGAVPRRPPPGPRAGPNLESVKSRRYMI